MEFKKSVRSYKIIHNKRSNPHNMKLQISLISTYFFLGNITYLRVLVTKKWRRVKYLCVYLSLFLIIIYYINKVCRNGSTSYTKQTKPSILNIKPKKSKFQNLAEILFIYLFPPHLYNFSSLLLFCGSLQLVCLKTNVM